MKIKRQFRLLILTMITGTLALPVSAIAGGSCCKGKGGLVFNQYDNKYYSVPCAYKNMVYRVVDNKYVPVKSYGCCYSCKHKHRYCHTMVKVKCMPTPGFWWGSTWMAPSQECYYVR